MIDQGKGKFHDLRMQNRKLLDITGVQNVESFDSEEFLLQTELGHLTSSGDKIYILKISAWKRGFCRLKVRCTP